MQPHAPIATDAVLGVASSQPAGRRGTALLFVCRSAPGGFDRFQRFEQGFVDRLSARMATETRRMSTSGSHRENRPWAAGPRAAVGDR
ncbi:hypothetical protein I3F58_01135 [Streptomyces sp. MUM 203J]|uniref:hypothetical protein n=1 Tax=Streptomyces sp. MUM 203J TaxID=2791990 RepID=UPI001F0468A6|nr:hypothetical protein [Streptomyces sp. MUM 203J]MCH0538185.1 hypothetical protein [Streptomyces sp. MUM 203J]